MPEEFRATSIPRKNFRGPKSLILKFEARKEITLVIEGGLLLVTSISSTYTSIAMKVEF